MIYEQYRALKRARPNVVLLMQVGDFYHAFDCDAQTLAAVTDGHIRTVTADAHRADTCCVPAAHIDPAIETLVRQGHTIAVAQPIGTPPPGQRVQYVETDNRLEGEVRA